MRYAKTPIKSVLKLFCLQRCESSWLTFQVFSLSKAFDRTHRIGQKETVVEHVFISKDTFEERIAGDVFCTIRDASGNLF